MLIRSQNKSSIRNFNLISDLVIQKHIFKSGECWEIIACYPYFAQNDCAYSVIGKYSTEEKAIKVLDMICNFATEKHYETIFPERCDCIGGVVFNMPQDDEL